MVLHQVGRGAEEVVELLCALVDLQALAQMRLLGGDTHGAVVGVAGPHPQATDCLDRRVRYRDGVGTQCQGLDKIGWQSQSAGNYQRHIAATFFVEITAGTGQCRDGGHRDVIAEDQRCGASATAPSIENDVVDADSSAESMSSSMCWAESLKPIGMPPVFSRTSAAKSRYWSTCSQSGKRGGEMAGVAFWESSYLGDACP